MRQRRPHPGRDDGTALVRAWVALYTVGLPASMRDRRREEIDADLAEETLDAVRRGTVLGLRSRRWHRLVAGIPADLAWRWQDAPNMAARLRVARPWVPPDRWMTALLAVVAVGATGGLALVAIPLLTGAITDAVWAGSAPVAVALAATGVVIGIPITVPAPRGGAAVVIVASVLGMAVSPALWGYWTLAALAVVLRLYQASTSAHLR